MEVWELADRHEREDLKRVCEHFIAYNFDGVASSPSFLALPKDIQKKFSDSKKVLQL